jgi:hypothetical protein
MLSVLHNVVDLDLLGLLRKRRDWRSVHVTYHPPRVERLWIQHGSFRVFLHRIWPCEEGEALLHPHQWPSAVQVMSGSYEHLTASLDETSPRSSPDHGPILCRSILTAGCSYEMTHPHAWHSVRPLGGPSDSIMVVGPLYAPAPTMPSPPTEKQGPLLQERFDALFEMWHDLLDRRVECHGCGWEGRRSHLAHFAVESPYARCPECLDEDQVCSLDRKEA